MKEMSRIASEHEKDQIREIRYSLEKWKRKRLMSKLPKALKNLYFPKQHNRKGYLCIN